jgi:hypothetical protein
MRLLCPVASLLFEDKKATPNTGDNQQETQSGYHAITSIQHVNLNQYAMRDDISNIFKPAK